MSFLLDTLRTFPRIMQLLTRLIITLFAFQPALAAANPPLDTCLAGLRAKASVKGISHAAYDQYTRGLVADMDVIAKLDYQPEFRTPIWDYLASLVDDERVNDGKLQLDEWHDTLERITSTYGVDAETVVAVWGVESNFGRNFGSRPLLTSLATLSCFGRRQSYFRGEFFTTLKILEEGHIEPEKLVGSWAGAFGHTQFMPSTFMRVAVDFDGDGRRDLVSSIPDALASTANYLKLSGWRAGQTWGYEVHLPSGFDVSRTGRRNKRTISDWAAQGITRIDGSPLSEPSLSAGILLPAGVDGPAFLVTRNFDAIYAYNAAESYALAIAHLSDRLRGLGGFVTPWPTDDPGVSRAERHEIQTLLLEHGYDIGEADGIIGTKTREAIMAIQPQLELAPDGHAGHKLLEALRRHRPGR